MHTGAETKVSSREVPHFAQFLLWVCYLYLSELKGFLTNQSLCVSLNHSWLGTLKTKNVNNLKFEGSLRLYWRSELQLIVL